MPLFDQLIHINTGENLLKKAYEHWHKEDSSLSKLMPLGETRLLKFEVNTGWSGVIDLQQWFCANYPKLAIMSVRCTTNERLYELFSSCEQPIIIPELPIYKSLQFERITAVDLIEANSYLWSQYYFSIGTKAGQLWITKLRAEHLPPCTKASINNNGHIIYTIPLYLKCILGQSKLSLSLFRKMNRGDILLIQQAMDCVVMNNQIIGNYKIDNETIMIDLHNFDFTDHPTNYKNDLYAQKDKINSPHNDEAEQQAEAVVLTSDYKNMIPITLSFVLDNREIKLAELESIAQGQIVSLPPECYKSIEIEANGMPIAKGEMVMLDDKIAVEIKAIYGESKVK